MSITHSPIGLYAQRTGLILGCWLKQYIRTKAGVMDKKWQSIDLFKLYSESDHTKWNKMLNKCYKNRDLKSLRELLYGVEVGMDDLVKKKMNTLKMVMWFTRLQTSIEKTAKKILRRQYPSPLDDTIVAKSMQTNNKEDYKKHLSIKRKRDQEFELWLKQMRF